MTSHITTEYVENFKKLCHENTDRKRQHEELWKIRKKKDEADVVKIVDTVMQQWNPFDIDTVPTLLINIVTGKVTTPEVQNSLTTFLAVEV